MRPKPVKEHGYWRSLDQLASDAEYTRFLHGEFPDPVELDEGEDAQASRRTFLKLMGASIALAGMTACRWPEEKIVPYASRPAGFAPGRAVRYATALDLSGVAIGLLATSVDGARSSSRAIRFTPGASAHARGRSRRACSGSTTRCAAAGPRGATARSSRTPTGATSTVSPRSTSRSWRRGKAMVSGCCTRPCPRRPSLGCVRSSPSVSPARASSSTRPRHAMPSARGTGSLSAAPCAHTSIWKRRT
ncbi:MAG: TAT-variant-translocated molybdopterin oxidoreductase [Acidobacteria bacterium]|nr:TAT-variant-translocated molybdopterin oxidoreductase [Acidobacteriota bacterium]